jgi:integration host factor subunit alpha
MTGTDKKTITKANMVKHLMQKNKLDRVQAKTIVDLFVQGMTGPLVEGKPVKIFKLGSFKVKDKKERPGRDLKTQKGVPVTARRVVIFRPSPTLKKGIQKLGA